MTPNILVLIWDSARKDWVENLGENFNSLAGSGLYFSNAVTPGAWSLPAHASLLTGKYPHQHRIYHESHDMCDQTVLDKMALDTRKYGISSNGFFSPYYNFDNSFDDFYTTRGQTIYPEGIDVYQLRKVIEQKNDGDLTLDINATIREIIKSEHIFKSVVNLSAGFLSYLVMKYPFFERIPHPRFNRYIGYSYSPNQNTKLIKNIINKHTNSEKSFLVTANYMDPHRPYYPPKKYQTEYANREYSYTEISDLNYPCKPWRYVELLQNDQDLSENKKDIIRNLYKGEIAHLDHHLGKIIGHLKEAGEFNDTLIIITSDHGENLFEEDRMGEQRVGHMGSVSENLLRVPFLIHHPKLPNANVHELFSTRRIADILEHPEKFLKKDIQNIKELLCEEIVYSQHPAIGHHQLYEKYPQVPRKYFDRNLCVGYTDSWKIVVSTHDEPHAWKNGSRQEITSAPEDIVIKLKEHLESFVSDGERDGVDAQTLDRLEQLGYL